MSLPGAGNETLSTPKYARESRILQRERKKSFIYLDDGRFRTSTQTFRKEYSPCGSKTTHGNSGILDSIEFSSFGEKRLVIRRIELARAGFSNLTLECCG